MIGGKEIKVIARRRRAESSSPYLPTSPHPPFFVFLRASSASSAFMLVSVSPTSAGAPDFVTMPKGGAPLYISLHWRETPETTGS